MGARTATDQASTKSQEDHSMRTTDPSPCYGCEAFDKPTEEMTRLEREWARWVIGAWRGSSARKVSELSGVDEVADIFWKKRIRWAASVYGRRLPVLRERAQEILEEAYYTHDAQ